MDPQQKAIANVFLDMIAAVDVDDPDGLPDNWLNSHTDQLGELDAIQFGREGDDVVSIDITPLVSSAALLVDVLVGSIAESRGADRLAVIHTIREHLDRNL